MTIFHIILQKGINAQNIHLPLIDKNKGKGNMEKNENGFSDFNFSRGGRLNCRGEMNTDQNGGSNGNGIHGEAPSLAMVYCPSQEFRMMYSHGEALKHGTLFEELYKPLMEGR